MSPEAGVPAGAIASHMACMGSLRGASATKQSQGNDIASLSLAMTAKRSSDAIALEGLGVFMKADALPLTPPTERGHSSLTVQ